MFSSCVLPKLPQLFKPAYQNMNFSVYLICSYFFHNFTGFQVNGKSRPRPPGLKDQHGNYIILSVPYFPTNCLYICLSVYQQENSLNTNQNGMKYGTAENVRKRKNEFVNRSVQPGTTEKNSPTNPSSIQPQVKGSWAMKWNTAKCSILSSPPPGICILLSFLCTHMCKHTNN